MILKKLFLFFLCLYFLSSCTFDLDQIGQRYETVEDESILLLHINGVITNELSEEFMSHIRDYVGDEKIKGVLVRINSPGGSVGASQEINSSIREIREFYKKPVFVSGGDIVASGGVYSIVSADKIYTNPGTLFGSIGVLMEFQDISELVNWAKMEVYHLKAGEFKDSGSPYRKMTLRERELFDHILEIAMSQFKNTIIEGRKLDPKVVESFSDGRVFSGAEAVEFGLADSIGSFNQVVREIGKKTGLGSDPILFEPGLKSVFEEFFESFGVNKSALVEKLFPFLNKLELLSGQPLYILPSYLSAQ